jgi:hypothetical protein
MLSNDKLYGEMQNRKEKRVVNGWYNFKLEGQRRLFSGDI